MNILFPIRRLFRIVTMIHKIIYIRFYDWQRKKKYKWIERRTYVVTILPELFLLIGTTLAAPEKNGYMHIEHTWEEIIVYTLWGWAFLGMAIPLNFGFDGKEEKIRKEVKKELREHPLYWKKMITIYFAAIVVAITAAHIIL
ncbi:MAG TPA: hypothetical protein IAA79_01515 [Candidatus Avirikenella pullistercoris]|nr:hypothetical protein [Candidatus Avirikenella pullistercoris]